MRITVALILLGTSPAAAQSGIYLALSGDTNPALHRLNLSTGATLESHTVTGHEFLSGGLAYIQGGGLFTIDGLNNPDRLFQIDTISGSGAGVGQTGFNWNIRGLTVYGFNSLLAVGDNALYIIDRNSGQATFHASISGSSRLDQITALGVSITGQAFVTDTGETDLFALETHTGQVTWIGSLGGSNNAFTDLSGTEAPGLLVGVRSAGGIYSIDTATATQTLLFPGTYSAIERIPNGAPFCYANCDGSTTNPVLTANDFMCFLACYSRGESCANCDNVGGLTGSDFICFIVSYADGCN
jgi:outer membrane protein assembly factor BamB